ncbi:MAG: hypothetical protein SWJ54_22180, partial [Cyanobacteriota bacterium]|nr:hypothetical protein [Cyanobacteriota bacterium]
SDYAKIDNRWNDYSQVDAIVAIRGFGKENKYKNKPATKLFNAWLAGVPAILGYESAYRAEGMPNWNYLEVTSFNELIFALSQLKSSQTLRHYLVKNGQIKVHQFQPENITHRWRYFLTEVATPAFEDWCSKSRRVQNMILEARYYSWVMNRGMSKVHAHLFKSLKR